MFQKYIFNSWVKVFYLTLLFCLTAQFAGGQTPDATTLEAGKTVERAIAAGEKYEYKIALN